MMDTEACKNFLEKKYLLLLRQPILEARKQYLALQPPPKKMEWSTGRVHYKQFLRNSPCIYFQENNFQESHRVHIFKAQVLD